VHRRLLKTGNDGGRLGVPEDAPQRAVHRDADERHDLRTKAIDLGFENLPAFEILGRLQHVDARTRPGDQVGHPDAPLRQPHVVFVRDRLGDDSGFVQETPEPVRRSGKVMAGRRGHHPGIDADEQDAHAGRDPIRQSKIGPIGLGAGAFRL
jgi:hypothetical protein